MEHGVGGVTAETPEVSQRYLTIVGDGNGRGEGLACVQSRREVVDVDREEGDSGADGDQQRRVWGVCRGRELLARVVESLGSSHEGFGAGE